MTANSIVGVVDDDASVRDSLRALLTAAGYQVRAYGSAKAYLRDDNSAVNCVVTDLRMSEMNGVELLVEITKLESGVPVILISGDGDLALAISAMKAGAVDFIEKPFANKDFLERVDRALCLGKRSRSDRDAVRIARGMLAQLTKREANVLDQLLSGRSNKLVAFELGISPRTVEIHRAHIMRKMNVRSVSDLVRIALVAQQLPDLRF